MCCSARGSRTWNWLPTRRRSAARWCFRPIAGAWTFRSRRSSERSSGGLRTVSGGKAHDGIDIADTVFRQVEPLLAGRVDGRSDGSGGAAARGARAGGGGGGFLRSTDFRGPLSADPGDRVPRRPGAFDAAGRDRWAAVGGYDCRAAGRGSRGGGAGADGPGAGWVRAADGRAAADRSGGVLRFVQSTAQSAGTRAYR